MTNNNLKKDTNTQVIARVIAEYKGLYKIKDETGEYFAEVTGEQKFKAVTREDFPVVGDWVEVRKLDSGRGIFQKILPRQSLLKTKDQVIATNIDEAFITESLDRDYNLNRFERYFVLVKQANIKPVIILNKIDLNSEAEVNTMVAQIKSRFPEADIISTSTVTQQGLSHLLEYLKKGKTYCFLGSSGVGKSSLINKLLRENRIKTAEISDATQRGKHTTTSREMYFLENGSIVIDNPGMREVGIGDSESGINDVFEEILNLAKKCRFANCTHNHEPNCAVQMAIKAKTLDESKFNNYLKLKKEDKFYEMTSHEKREKNKKFGKFIKKAKEQIYAYRGR